MSIPKKLLQAAFATLSRDSLLAAAQHNGVDPTSLSSIELANRLSKDGINLQSYVHSLTLVELKRIAELFGVETRAKKKDLATSIYLYVDNYDKRTKPSKKDNKVGITSSFTSGNLWEAGQKLNRPTVQLTQKKSKQRIALWNANPAVEEGLNRWLSIDLRYHPEETVCRDGILDVYVDLTECTATVEFRAEKLRRAKKGEQSLFGHDCLEAPNIELLFKQGPKQVQRWLDEMEKSGWENRDWPDDPSFCNEAVVQSYRKRWQKQHPLYGRSVYAQLGGWPLNWPEESAVDQLKRTLVLRTYRGAEPWIEVFQKGKKYSASYRIT